MSAVTSIVLAADFAAKKHKDQRRKDPEGTPYINHPIGVAQILTEVGSSPGPTFTPSCFRWESTT